MQNKNAPSTKHQLLGVFVLMMWVSLLGIAFADSRGLLGTDIGLEESLRTSSLARIMFADIGMMSMIVAAWIMLATKSKLRIVVAVLTLFVGSFAALPYIGYYLLTKQEHEA